jgi:hypothetical protein
MCLVNNAVYIAKYKDGKHAGDWTATGKQFQVPYVFKKLFSKELITFDDMCEAFEVKTALHLNMNEDLPEGENNYCFIGKVGSFCPIKPGCGGGELVREATDSDGNLKYDSATGAKDYRWLEAEVVKTLGKQDDIDRSYYDKLVDDAVEAISQYGDFEWFVSDDPVENDGPIPPWDTADDPWFPQCGNKEVGSCWNCPKLHNDQFHFDCELGYDVSDLIDPNEHCAFDVR